MSVTPPQACCVNGTAWQTASRQSHLSSGGVKIEAWSKGHMVMVVAISLLVCARRHDKQKCLLFAPLRAANSAQQLVRVSDSDPLSCSLCHLSVNRHAETETALRLF